MNFELIATHCAVSVFSDYLISGLILSPVSQDAPEGFQVHRPNQAFLLPGPVFPRWTGGFCVAPGSTSGPLPGLEQIPRASKEKSVSVKFSLFFCYIFNCRCHFKALVYFYTLLIYFLYFIFIL